MSPRPPLPVVELDPDSYALFAEHTLDGGPVAVAPQLLRLAADAASVAARSGPPEEREFAAQDVAIFRRALRRWWWRRYGWDSKVILAPAAETKLAESGITDELVLVRPSTVVRAAWRVAQEPTAVAWRDGLADLVSTWLRISASVDEEAWPE